MIFAHNLITILVSLLLAGGDACRSANPILQLPTGSPVTAAPGLKPVGLPWDSAAEAAQTALLKHFWFGQQGYFTRYSQLLQANGTVLLQQGTSKPDFLFGLSPDKLPGRKTDSSLQLSGTMLLEALARLQRHKYLD